MSKAALFIKNRALPGKRDEVRRIWFGLRGQLSSESMSWPCHRQR